MRLWYCIQSYPKHEIIARQQLERRGFPVFDPTYLVKYGNRHIAHRRLFGRYMFVALENPLQWPEVAHTIGVAEVITGAAIAHDQRKPGDSEYRKALTINRSHSIESLREQALSMDEIRRDGKPRAIAPPKAYITAGCCVRILSGPLVPFSIQNPIVEWADEERAALVLQLFGKDMRVEFYQRDLERVD